MRSLLGARFHSNCFLLNCSVFLCFCVSLTHAQAPPRTVTKEDMPRIPSTVASEALGTFHLAQGFSLELVASEPMVGDPVDACFDERGRMYVAEMHGYPFSEEPTRLNPAGGGKKAAGIIRLLEDTNGDGLMDRSEVFADQISWPTSICCYNGGVFVVAPQYLYYFKDTTGDGRADVREAVLEGFGRGNVQSVSNGLLWDLDNHIYFAAGRNPKDLKHRGKPMFAVGQADLRFNPKTETFEQVSGGLQFGHCIDDWGVRFVCSNSNHMQQVVYDRKYLTADPSLAARGAIRSVAADGASARVFRKSPPEPWRIVRQKWRAADKGYRLVVREDGRWEFLPLDPSKKKGAVPTEYPVGYFTSATGITIYRGDAYPREFWGNAFVGDVGGNLVHRKTVDTSGVVYVARRADEGEEMVASTDNWFRPVNFVNAPDGSLYILDMYRETIEHPYSIPEEIKKFLDLSSGDRAGRVYRLVSPKMMRRRVKNLGAMTSAELVGELDSTNGWNRETAQRLLWERGDKSVAGELKALVARGSTAKGRMHAAYVLQGLGQLDVATLKTLLVDSHPRVRTHAIRLAEQAVLASAALAGAGNEAEQGNVVATWLEGAGLVDDDNEHVRFQLCLTLGQLPASPVATRLLAALAIHSHTPETLAAWRAAGKPRASELSGELLANPKFRSLPHASAMIIALGEAIGADSNEKALHSLEEMTAWGLSFGGQQQWLESMARGAAQRRVSLEALLDEASDGLRDKVGAMFAEARRIGSNSSESIANRASAISLLGFAPWDSVADLRSLLNPQTPRELQLAVVRALGRHSDAEAARTLLKSWRSYGPDLRRAVATQSLGKTGAFEGVVGRGRSGRRETRRSAARYKAAAAQPPSGGH